MIILGINSYFEHPSVALLKNGEILFAAEDERFTRIKHGRRYNPFLAPYLPVDAIYAALRTTGAHIRDVEALAYSYSGHEHLKGLWSTFFGKRDTTLYEEVAAYTSLKRMKLAIGSGHTYSHRQRDLLDPKQLVSLPFRQWPHHHCHAASAFFCSGYEQALTVVCDGASERFSTSIFLGKDDKLKPIATMPDPNSLGLFYSFVTAHLGFEMFADEFKVMGLAAYGQGRYVPQLRSILRTIKSGRYVVDLPALKNLHVCLGGYRAPNEPIKDIHRDIAHSAQVVLEETLQHVIGYHLQKTKMSRLCLAGGTFMNCVANGRIAQKDFIKEIFVQPAAHDGGTAIGAAVLSWKAAQGRGSIQCRTMALGTEYDNNSIRSTLESTGVKKYEPLTLINVATRLKKGQIGALFRGRMEFGSRALGQRSIIASPCHVDMRTEINSIKEREDFRPVSPMIIREAFSTYFIGYKNAFMSFTVEARECAKKQIPAVVHIDGSARPQVVDQKDHPFLHKLLLEFGKLSGHPVLINTSFNTRGQPIVETPIQALECFFTTKLDFLVLGKYLVLK